MLKYFIMTVLSFSNLIFFSPLNAELKILAFAGSTRVGSYNKMLILEAANIARQMGATVTVIDLKDYPMPYYNEDLESKQGMPETAQRLRRLMLASDAVIIASPEYNGSLSGILKNTIDWMSRAEDGKGSQEAYTGRKFAIMSTSPGAGGGARVLSHLRTIIENIGGEVIAAQVTIPNASFVFNQQGQITNPAIKQEISKEVQQLIQAVEKRR